MSIGGVGPSVGLPQPSSLQSAPAVQSSAAVAGSPQAAGVTDPAAGVTPGTTDPSAVDPLQAVDQSTAQLQFSNMIQTLIMAINPPPPPRSALDVAVRQAAYSEFGQVRPVGDDKVYKAGPGDQSPLGGDYSDF